eukprot:m.232002 g.232002  ORF g.232002 m.232002 type:complete len:50 (-) comp15703_c0_seq6:20-169(-)
MAWECELLSSALARTCCMYIRLAAQYFQSFTLLLQRTFKLQNSQISFKR